MEKDKKEKTKDETIEEASSRLAQIFVDIIDNKTEKTDIELEEKIKQRRKND